MEWRKNPPPNPRRKTYNSREELAQNSGILRSPRGRFAQLDTGESRSIEMRRELESNSQSLITLLEEN